MELQWQCPRCNAVSQEYKMYTDGVRTELEVVCPECDLRWYPENLRRFSYPEASIISLQCPNCGTTLIQRMTEPADGKDGMCLTCGFRWNIEENKRVDEMYPSKIVCPRIRRKRKQR